MKKVILPLLVVTAVVFTSCKKDEKKTVAPVAEAELMGEKTGDLTLDASVSYKLVGKLVMKSGTLTIPAGTKIVATDVSDDKPEVRYIAIAQGAKIVVEGTATNPVVMTAETKQADAWGGLVICGSAPHNKSGVSGGTSTSEVADLTYGGSNIDDNSGSIKYLRVEYTGYKYTETKEFNGISFFGVGAGTTVEYVSSYEGGDDGLEFFGGNVNPKYLVSIKSGDDGIDFADGFNGTGMYWYVKDAAKSSIEASNNGSNFASDVPMTNATLKYITLVGSGEKPWYFKEGAGKQNIDNVVIGGLTNNAKGPYLYFDSSDADAKARATDGSIVVTNIKFIDTVVDKARAEISFTENANATGAGNGAEMPAWASGWSVPAE